MKLLGPAVFLFSMALPVGAAEAPLSAGIGEFDVSPKIDGKKTVYIAGFGHDRKATAVHDPIMARAVVLCHGSEKIALACVDVVGLFPATVDAIRKELPEFRYVLVSATHNHEGPDTLGLWGKTPFTSGIDPDYLRELQKGIVKAIKLAEAAAQPVSVRIGSIHAPDLLHDSRLPICLHDEIVAIEFTTLAEKKRHGVLVQWNCHPETLDAKNDKVSADFVAGAVKELRASQQCPVAYFTGTVGGLMSSLKVKIPGPDGKLLADGTFEKTEAYGKLLAKQADTALKNAVPTMLTPFDVRTRRVQLPVDNRLYQLAWQIGVLQRPVYAWNEDRKSTDWQPAADFAKRRALQTEVGYLKLGELEIAAIPGEIYPELVLNKVENPAAAGADFPEAPIEPAIYSQLKGRHHMLIGLANDEVGYLIPKRQWDEKPPYCYGLKQSQYGEINSTGPDAAAIICETFADLVKSPK